MALMCPSAEADTVWPDGSRDFESPDLGGNPSKIEESAPRRSFSGGMRDARGFELWWEEQIPRLTCAYLPLLATCLGDGTPPNSRATRLWVTRVLPALHAGLARTVDDFEQRVGFAVGVDGIDVVTGTVAAPLDDNGGTV